MVLPGARAVTIDETLGRNGILSPSPRPPSRDCGGATPDLIVGHGILGRMIARIESVGSGHGSNRVGTDPNRRGVGIRLPLIDPADDTRCDYRTICDASGPAEVLDLAFGRLGKGGEMVLAGFYDRSPSPSRPPSCARRGCVIAAEFTPCGLAAILTMVETGMLALDGLISHARPAAEAWTPIHRVRRPALPQDGPRLEPAMTCSIPEPSREAEQEPDPSQPARSPSKPRSSRSTARAAAASRSPSRTSAT